MARSATPFDDLVLSHHAFTRPRIRFWLPFVMLLMLLLCAIIIPPKIHPLEIVGFLAVIYVSISALVPICEFTVLQNGLIIYRLLLPERFVPWNAIDRVLIFSRKDMQNGSSVEITSIGIYEGLSPLNRLPGLLYGQGLRQTIVVTPDAVENYAQLIDTLTHHCAVFRSRSH